MGILVICSYKPKAGKEDALKALLGRHVPVLQSEGLATDRAPLHMTAEDGTVVEIFEWASEEAARSAEGNKAVQGIWGEFAQVCDFVPLGSLKETGKPFAHFKPLG